MYLRFDQLSSQQIIDCSIAYGNLACAGGSLKNTLRYLKKVGGIMQGRDYSYKAKVCFWTFTFLSCQSKRLLGK